MLRYITQKATVSYYKSKQFQSSEGKVSLYPRIKKLDPTYMPQDLRKAHNELDKIVDVALGATKPCSNNDERLEILFKSYIRMTKE